MTIIDVAATHTLTGCQSQARPVQMERSDWSMVCLVDPVLWSSVLFRSAMVHGEPTLRSISELRVLIPNHIDQAQGLTETLPLSPAHQSCIYTGFFELSTSTPSRIHLSLSISNITRSVLRPLSFFRAFFTLTLSIIIRLSSVRVTTSPTIALTSGNVPYSPSLV